MRFSTLSQWLAWQESLHSRGIDLGLDRVREVWQRLGAPRPAPVVVTVAGTNGKGSCVALLEAILASCGLRVGCYTSPHLLRYNERMRIGGREIDDDSLCQAFARVDGARDACSLTYFEFGTLAALDLFARAGLDVALLEVGMGGRLDAVNLIDADAALVTTVDLDHMQWLGPDREAIGREKAGVFRVGRPAVVGESRPPRSLLARARAVGAVLYRLGRDYHYRISTDGRSWDWWHGRRRYQCLPAPALAGDWQFANAAAVLMVLEALRPVLTVTPEAIASGLQRVRLPGRLQCFPGTVSCVVDVAHNRQAAMALARFLRHHPLPGQSGEVRAGSRTHAVWAMLEDKTPGAMVEALGEVVQCWHVAGLEEVSRGASAARLEEALACAGVAARDRHVHTTVAHALRAAFRHARPGDRVVVCGSFHTAAAALPLLASGEFGLDSAGGESEGGGFGLQSPGS